MALKFTYRPDGSIKSAISVNPDGTPKARSNTPLPLPDYMYGNGSMMLGTMPQTSLINDAIDFILGQQKMAAKDPFTGGSGVRTMNDFKRFFQINKEGFSKKFGEKEGLKAFNNLLDQVQQGFFSKLTEEEAKYVDDLKNNRINL